MIDYLTLILALVPSILLVVGGLRLRCGPRDCPTSNRASSQSSLGNGRQRLGFAVRGQTQLAQEATLVRGTALLMRLSEAPVETSLRAAIRHLRH